MKIMPLPARASGVLLPLFALPGPGERGRLGEDARRFVRFLADSGFAVWQLLPLTPPHGDGSPYNCSSTFAGNPDLISLQALKEEGLIDRQQGALPVADSQLWLKVRERFASHSDDQAAFQAFCRDNQQWLHDYSRFQTLKALHEQQCWCDWPQPLRDREPDALAELDREHGELIEAFSLQQFLFYQQYRAFKAYANDHDIAIFGDLPIFVSYDSAECWTEPALFKLDDERKPEWVTGVPPDYFSETGQRWGNPCYDWEVHRQSNFDWWMRRLNHHFQLFDMIRIDHFRGFAACWEIPADEETAINGSWQKAPGEELFTTLKKKGYSLPIVAEDLGLITEDVEALRKQFQFPGMKVLQFAFDSDGDNPYLPHHHKRNCVVYTGTHDNNTTLGWYQELKENERERVQQYLGYPGEDMPWPLMRAALASVADLTILPMQDLLELDASHRTNTPGTSKGNWRFRFQWEQLPDGLEEKLERMNALYDRRR